MESEGSDDGSDDNGSIGSNKGSDVEFKNVLIRGVPSPHLFANGLYQFNITDSLYEKIGGADDVDCVISWDGNSDWQIHTRANKGANIVIATLRGKDKDTPIHELPLTTQWKTWVVGELIPNTAITWSSDEEAIARYGSETSAIESTHNGVPRLGYETPPLGQEGYEVAQAQEEIITTMEEIMMKRAAAVLITGFNDATYHRPYSEYDGVYVIVDGKDGSFQYQKKDSTGFVIYNHTCKAWEVKPKEGVNKVNLYAQLSCYPMMPLDMLDYAGHVGSWKEKVVDGSLVGQTSISITSDSSSLDEYERVQLPLTDKMKEEYKMETKKWKENNPTPPLPIVVDGFDDTNEDSKVNGVYRPIFEDDKIRFYYTPNDSRNRIIEYCREKKQWQMKKKERKGTDSAAAYVNADNPRSIHSLVDAKWFDSVGFGSDNFEDVTASVKITFGDSAVEDYEEYQGKEGAIKKQKQIFKDSKTIAVYGARGLYSRNINGVYDPTTEIINNGAVYVRRDKKVIITRYSNSSWVFQDKKDKADDDYSGIINIEEESTQHPKPLQYAVIKNVDIWEGGNWAGKKDIKISSSSDEISKCIKAEDDFKEKYKISQEFGPDKEEVNFGDEGAVDEMKIQTMYKMVEDVVVNIDGREVTKKVLYLTNKQASMFDDQSMLRCIEALDIGEPKFVILLLPSYGDLTQNMIAHSELYEDETSKIHYAASHYSTSEISEYDRDLVETQTLLFFKNCILPLAKQTKALIVCQGANDCFLSATMSKVVLAEQARLGKDCPFSVIALAREFEVHYKATLHKERNSLASQIARGSASWRKRACMLDRFHCDKTSIEFQQRCDLTGAASRFIIFESMNEDGITMENFLTTFKSVFTQCITKRLPSIAIQSHHTDKLSDMVDLLARNIPILLLDTNERSFTIHQNVKEPSSKLAKEARAFSYLRTTEATSILKDVAYGSLSSDSRNCLLDIAEKMVMRKWSILIKYGVYDSLNTSQLAFFHSALTIGHSIKAMTEKSTTLHKAIEELERLERGNMTSKNSYVHPDYAKRVVKFILQNERAMMKKAELSKVSKFIRDLDENSDDDDDDDDDDLSQPVDKAAEGWQFDLQVACDLIKEAGDIVEDTDGDEFLAHMDVLSNQLTYSGSIHNIDDLDRTLRSVAKIDRLPSSNSLEALRSLQDAWNHIEYYEIVANHYKNVAKILYIAMILIGIAISLLAIIELETKSIDYNFTSRVPILVLSLIGTVVVSYVGYTNPGVRWQQLRIASLNIRSNIFLFRCRAGIYRLQNGNDDEPVELLKKLLRIVKTSVIEGADLKGTSFFSVYRTRLHGHGQHSKEDLDAALQLKAKYSRFWYLYMKCRKFLISFHKEVTVFPLPSFEGIEVSDNGNYGIDIEAATASITSAETTRRSSVIKPASPTSPSLSSAASNTSGIEQREASPVEAHALDSSSTNADEKGGDVPSSENVVPLEQLLMLLLRSTEGDSITQKIDSHYEPIQVLTCMTSKVAPYSLLFLSLARGLHQVQTASGSGILQDQNP